MLHRVAARVDSMILTGEWWWPDEIPRTTSASLHVSGRSESSACASVCGCVGCIDVVRRWMGAFNTAERKTSRAWADLQGLGHHSVIMGVHANPAGAIWHQNGPPKSPFSGILHFRTAKFLPLGHEAWFRHGPPSQWLGSRVLSSGNTDKGIFSDG